MNISLIIDFKYFQLAPLILEIYILAPELWKNYSLVLVSFWKELGMVYGWNFGMVIYLHFDPVLVSLHFGFCFEKLSF